MKKTSKCVICGATFPSAVVWPRPCRENNYASKPFPKEICDTCAAPPDKNTPKVSGKVYRYPSGTLPYVQLAGEIECLVLCEYRRAYEKCLDAADKMRFDVLLTDDEEAFLLLHKRITETEGAYHQALTMSNLPDLLDAARREVEQSDKRFQYLKKRGYDVFERWEAYKAWKKSQAQKENA